MTARGPQRARFRRWRRSRPFWGGLLLLLGGLEMLLIPLTGVLARGQIKLVIYVGIGGVFGILLGGLLIACALALWFNPVHKTFYAITGVLLSLLSFIGSNLGGFFIGLLLGIMGGSLAFAWSPGPAAPEPEPGQSAARPGLAGTAATGGLELVAGDLDPDDEPGPDQDPPDEPPPADWGLSQPRPGRRRRAAHSSWSGSFGRSLAVAALLAAGGAALTGGGRASAAEDHPAQTQQARQAQSGHGCVLLIICSSSSPAPSPTPSASKSGGPGHLPIPDVLPSTGSLPTSVAGLGGGAGGIGGVVGQPGGQQGQQGRKQAEGPDDKAARGTRGLVVPRETAVITARSVTLSGLAYQGTVNLPVSGGGMVTMMKFTMSSQRLSGLDLTVTGTGGTLATATPSASFSGEVVLYATRLTGQLAGVPLTLTPGNAESTLLQVLNSLTPAVPITLTDVTADQPVVLGSSGVITSLSARAS